eukprot:6213198-Pleurochrysis_carterae.AAC.8
MLEMNFAVLQHFLASASALCERLRRTYADAYAVGSSVGRHSLEFGASSIQTARQARSRLNGSVIGARAVRLGAITIAIAILSRFVTSRRRWRPDQKTMAEAIARSALESAWPHSC